MQKSLVPGLQIDQNVKDRTLERTPADHQDVFCTMINKFEINASA